MSFVKEDIKIEYLLIAIFNKCLVIADEFMKREKSFYERLYDNCFFLGTGVRAGELINLKWSDIDLIHGHVSIFGKKRRQSSISITEKLIKELSQFKVFCEKRANGLSEFVFPNRYNKKITENGIECIFLQD